MEVPIADHQLHGLIEAARRAVIEALRPLIRDAPAVALLDFPMHSNVGDSAIWLGALAALRELGVAAPCCTCDADNYDRAALARAIGRGVILFTGGGSFGDLWEKHLRFRERVVMDFPDNAIVQLPESVHFERVESLARCRAVFNAHGQVSLMARDEASLAIFRNEFHAPSQLVPDLAFMLGAQERSMRPVHDVLWLKRNDKEDRWRGRVAAPTTDWVDEPRAMWLEVSARARTAVARREALRPLERWMQARLYPQLARHRVARGVALLSAARVIVTDRLHGHLLALLLGIPHVVLDNSYGKLRNFVAAWTHTSPLVHQASDPDEASRRAHSLLAASHPSE